jgi:hypothetical protein
MEFYYKLTIIIFILIIAFFWGTNIYDRYIKKIEFFDDTASCITPTEAPLGPTTVVPYNDDIAYMNPTNNPAPWMHHKMASSLEQDPKIIFPNAYYYEFDNQKYVDGLNKALSVPCTLLSDAVNQSNWSISIEPDPKNPTLSIPADVVDAYNACLTYIDKKLNSSSSMILPGDDPSKPSYIQIVHDIFLSYKSHVNSDGMYLIDLEVVLYRENKQHGKDVKVRCTTKSTHGGWIVNVVALDLVGVVSEDEIGLFPVTASNPFDINALKVEDDISMTSPQKVNADTITANDMVQQHDKLWSSVAHTHMKIDSSYSGNNLPIQT